MIDFLKAVPMFSGLPENQLEALNKTITSRDYTRGETIFSEGDEGNGFYIAASGSIKIFKLSFDGKEQILHIYGPGEPFGEVAVFTGIPFPANSVALKKSRVLFIDGKKFTALLIKDPSLSLKLLGILSVRLKQFTVQVENLSLKEVPGRLAEHLIWLSNDQTNRKEVTLEISKGHLASLLGTIPETLSRILGKMNSESIIEVHGKKIIIQNYDKLLNLSQIGRLEDLD